ncbi:MAG: glucosamine-6-phosphate deaminase [Clostridiaceae bacterium]|nr:glucosamine-6-phosphate deaminase [Clostridiaceae bacterium]
MIDYSARLHTRIFVTRKEMGEAAADDFERIAKKLLAEQDEINIVFAAAVSQSDFFAALAKKDLPWSRMQAWHMDEYLGLPPTAPQCFGNFLRDAIFERVNFKKVNYINDMTGTPEEVAAAYSAAYNSRPIDIVCMGIGENAHIAFNDPGEADFHDPETVKVVNLDDKCRQQQVNDGAFPTFDDVPKQALTLTVPALARAKYHLCMVPAPSKAQAVADTLLGPITDMVPATVLRLLPNAALYLDRDSAALFLEKIRPQV